MWKITRLNAETVSSYEGMTFPKYRDDLRKLPPGFLALGASFLGQPIGLALASLLPGMKDAVLLSLMVKDVNRSKGIGGALLARLEAELLVLGAEKVTVSYTTRSVGIPAFERVLARQEWSEPLTRLNFYRARAERWVEVPWLVAATLPQGFEVFPWRDLTNGERWALLKAKKDDDWMEMGLNPFLDEEQIEADTSLGLRYHGELAGWLITHRVSASTLRYSSLYVFPRFQKMARAIPLIAEALSRQVEMGIPYSDWMVSLKNPAMETFVQRRLEPYLLSVAEARRSEKILIRPSLN